MSKIRKALTAAVGAAVAAVADAVVKTLTTGAPLNWGATLSVAVGAAVTVGFATWKVTNEPE